MNKLKLNINTERSFVKVKNIFAYKHQINLHRWILFAHVRINLRSASTSINARSDEWA